MGENRVATYHREDVERRRASGYVQEGLGFLPPLERSLELPCLSHPQALECTREQLRR